MDWLNVIGNGLKDTWDNLGDAAGNLKDSFDRDPNGYQGKLGAQGAQAGGWADTNQARFGNTGAEMNTNNNYLRGIQSGENSVSRTQLGQALQQNQATQQSMAAGARPGSAAMSARTAAMNAGRLGAGLAGQQAVAGQQERNAATSALAQSLQAKRQQELQAALGSRGQSIGAYGTAYTGAMGNPSTGEKFLGLATGGLKLPSFGGGKD